MSQEADIRLKASVMILALRQEEGMTQHELADAIGVPRQKISELENARVNLNVRDLVELGRFFNVHMEQICTGVPSDLDLGGEQ